MTSGEKQVIYHVIMPIIFWFKYDLGQKHQAPQVRPDRGSNSWPPDHDSTLHVTETPALTTWSSMTLKHVFCQLSTGWRFFFVRQVWIWNASYLECLWVAVHICSLYVNIIIIFFYYFLNFIIIFVYFIYLFIYLFTFGVCVCVCVVGGAGRGGGGGVQLFIKSSKAIQILSWWISFALLQLGLTVDVISQRIPILANLTDQKNSACNEPQNIEKIH